METNLKKDCLTIINDQEEIAAAMVIVDDGGKASAIIAGEGERLLNLLVTAMVKNPKFRMLVGEAYLASVAHSMKG